METLLIFIISAALCLTKVISTNAFLIIAAVGVVWQFSAMALYFKLGFLKIWYHDVLGWHTPDNSPHYYDGLSEHARCKHCGKDIMQDSQGNWF